MKKIILTVLQGLNRVFCSIRRAEFYGFIVGQAIFYMAVPYLFDLPYLTVTQYLIFVVGTSFYGGVLFSAIRVLTNRPTAEPLVKQIRVTLTFQVNQPIPLSASQDLCVALCRRIGADSFRGVCRDVSDPRITAYVIEHPEPLLTLLGEVEVTYIPLSC